MAGAIVVSGRCGEESGGASQRLWESMERSDEENLKEECSSTESTQQEVRGDRAGLGRGWRGGNERIKAWVRPE